MNNLTQSVLHTFSKNIDKYPDNNAIHVGGEYYSYKEFAALISSIQKSLKDNNLQDEKLIGVLTIDDVYTYASIMAIMFNGSAYIPINNKNPQHRNSDIIHDTNLKAILASVEHDAIKNADGDFSIINTAKTTADDDKPIIENFSTDNIAYILFTSGSTGRPKGVPIKHRSISTFLKVMLSDDSAYNFDENDRFLQMFELTFDMSISSILLPFCVGACCYVMPQQGISYMNIINLLKDHKITITQMVPSVLLYIERFFGELHFPDVRLSFFAGEGLPVSILAGWQKVISNAQIVNLYGPTESTIYCFRHDWVSDENPENILNGLVSIGRPWPGIEACVIDEELQPVSDPSIKGELCVKGDQVTDGYWNDPVKTAAAFVTIEDFVGSKTYYRTGDHVYINSLGNYMYCGRVDHQVKIDGHRVELGEIEHHIRVFSESSLVAAIIKQNANLTQSVLTVYIEANKQKPEQEIMKYMRDTLPPYMIPKKIFYIDKMPINLNGKIDRNALKDKND